MRISTPVWRNHDTCKESCKKMILNFEICIVRISSLNEFRYNLPYPEMTGGALAIRSDQFSILNGFSNQFYGWGGEDDEFHRRLVDHDLLPLRLPPMHARYISLTHKKQSLKSSIDFNSIKPELDGLKTLNYTVESMQLLRQYTLINVLL